MSKILGLVKRTGERLQSALDHEIENSCISPMLFETTLKSAILLWGDSSSLTSPNGEAVPQNMLDLHKPARKLLSLDHPPKQTGHFGRIFFFFTGCPKVLWRKNPFNNGDHDNTVTLRRW